MALAQDRITVSKWTGRYIDPIGLAAATVVYNGGLAAVNAAGNLAPASGTIGLRVVGVAQCKGDNAAGAAGAVAVGCLTGVFKFKNSGTRPLTAADRGRVCYVEDDETVQDEGAGSEVIAGIVEAVRTDGVYVFVDPAIGAGNDMVGIDIVATATALSLYTRTSLLTPTGTMAMTLGAGRYVGQRKTIRQTGGASTPISNVAGAYVTDGVATTSAAFNANADQLELEWNGAAWQVLANTSVVLS
jgi:hypothetical protein